MTQRPTPSGSGRQRRRQAPTSTSVTNANAASWRTMRSSWSWISVTTLAATVVLVACCCTVGVASAFSMSPLASSLSPASSNILQPTTYVGRRNHPDRSHLNNFHGISGSSSSSAGAASALSMTFGRDDDIEGPDRIKSCIPYLLPLIDGDTFGTYIYQRIPPLKFADDILLRPAVDAVQAAPLLSLGLFILLSIGPRLANLSRPVRFNAQQAILIDIALIFPQLIGEAIVDQNVPRSLLEPCTNFVYYAYMSCVIYSIAMNLRGKKPDGIPFISGWSEMAIGPF